MHFKALRQKNQIRLYCPCKANNLDTLPKNEYFPTKATLKLPLFQQMSGSDILAENKNQDFQNINMLEQLHKFIIQTKFYKRIYKIYTNLFINYLPINKSKIVFHTMNGAYSCNPKYICDEIIRRKLPYELVWLTKLSRKDGHFPPEVRLVSNRLKAHKERSTSHVMICNARTDYFYKGYRKKSGQAYIQTWHGSYGIKKMEGDCVELLGPEAVNLSRTDSENIDVLLSCGTWATDTFKRCFWCSPEVIKETGTPRNDIFFNRTDDIHHTVRQYYHLNSETKIALYAPTFRSNGDSLKCYQIDYESLQNELENKFGGKWVVITRLHPLLKHLYSELPTNVINGCSYPDMQELMSASDIMISDYSSCIYDFMLSRRPGFIFATDIELYNTERGFYYPLEETPFPIASSNEQLASNIQNFDLEAYIEKVNIFLQNKGSCDDGHASERCVDLIEKYMQA